MDDEFENIDEHIIIQSKLVSINSKYGVKLNGNKHSSILFDFNSIAPKDINNLYHTIAIQSAEIPASYYNVNNSNNKINITESASGSTITLTIPDGNYDANTYAAAFILVFNAAAFTNNATLAFNTTTGKFSLMSDTNGTNLTLNLATTTARDVLGISETATGTLAFNYAAGDPTFMPLPANFLGVTKIKVLSNALAGENFDSNNLNTTTLIDTVSATATPFGLTTFNSLGRESFVKAKRIDDIDIQVLDQNNNFINFNGINWTMTLILNTHKRQLFSRTEGSISNDVYISLLKAKKKKESIKEELENVEFDII